MTEEIIPKLSGILLHLFGPKADELGKKYKLVQREGGKVKGSNFSQMLVFGWLNNPEATLNNLCSAGRAAGLAITPQGLDQRLNTKEAAAFMKGILAEACQTFIEADQEVAVAVMSKFSGVYLRDSSHCRLPETLIDEWPDAKVGKKATQAIIKWEVQLELNRGELNGPHISPHYVGDTQLAKCHPPLPPDSLVIMDLGYWRLDEWAVAPLHNHYLLSPYRYHTQFYTMDGQLWRIDEYLQTKDSPFCLEIQMGKNDRIPVRLVALPLTPEMKAARIKRYQEEGSKKRQTLSAGGRLRSGWLIFVTNAPAHLLSPNEILLLARLRWQIELLFKLWKSPGGVTTSRSQKPQRILCEMYAKLLAMVVQHWCFLTSCWQFPDKSLTKAAGSVRQNAPLILFALSQPASTMITVLSHLAQVLSHASRINKSRQTPRSFQLLLAVETYAFYPFDP